MFHSGSNGPYNIVATVAVSRPYKWVLHTETPSMTPASLVKNVLLEADRWCLESVAFPTVGTTDFSSVHLYQGF